MSRDSWQLHVFCKADELAVRIYEATKGFPVEEHYGLQGNSAAQRSPCRPTSLKDLRGGRRATIYISSTLRRARHLKAAISFTFAAGRSPSRSSDGTSCGPATTTSAVGNKLS